IVENNDGVMIYAGGDDVLALSPIDTCLDTVKQLHDEFASQLSGFASNDDDSPKPTFSAGIVIAHILEPLDMALEWAREAEHHAKEPDRDGLAIHLHSRSGAPVKCKFKWAEDPVNIIMNMVRKFKNMSIPRGLAYAVRDFIAFNQDFIDAGTHVDLISNDLKKLLSRKNIKKNMKNEIESIIFQLVKMDRKNGKMSLQGINAMLVAKHISRASSISPASNTEVST
ncbi:MAG: type III-B CRISPR-associated protein Cas10/Cmr2, partial [Promethearchaeota archaeon]